VADKQFEALVGQGTQYADYLQKQIVALEQTINAGVGTTEDEDKLVKLQASLYYENGGIEKFKKGITDTAEEFSTLTERLEFFRREQEKLGNTKDERTAFLAEQIVGIEKQRKDLLAQYFIETNTNEAKRLGIQAHFNDLRAALDKNYLDKKSQAYRDAYDRINNDELKSLAELDTKTKDVVEKASNELDEILDSGRRKKLVGFIEQMNQQLTEFQLSGKDTKGIEAAIDNANEGLKELDTSSLGELFTILGQTGQELSNAEGQLGKFGKSLVDTSRQAQLFFTAIKAGAKPTEIVSSITGLLLNTVSRLINQKKEERRLQLANNAAMNEYNYLLTEKIRLESIARSNGFTQNYEGQIDDTASALTKASSDYTNAIRDLQNAEGPEITAKPIFGLWGKEVRIDNLTSRYKDLVNEAGELNVELASSLLNSEALSDEEQVMLDNAIKASKELEKVREQGKNIIQDLVGQVANNLRQSLIQAFKDGTSAAEAFGKSVSEIMADVAVKLLFDKVMQPTYERFSAEINESLYGKTGDRSIIDDIERYQDYGLKAAETFYGGIKEVQDSIIEKTGINPFNGTQADGNSLSGSIKSVTEETAGVLAGQMNAIRMTQATSLEVNRSQLLALTTIANNSEYLKHLELLKSIDKKLSSGVDLRSGGIDV
jgi:hypothetical protein